MKIRNPTIEDALSIAKVHVESWQVGYRGLFPDRVLDNLSVSKRTENWTNQITKNSSSILISESENRIVGFTAFGPCRESEFDPSNNWEIYSLYVLPSEWRKNHGATLWQTVVGQARSNQVTNLYLWVFKENKPSISFYKKLGMELDNKMIKQKEREGFTIPEERYFINL